MADRGVDDLEREENWDYGRAERRPGRRSQRTVLSIAFPRDDWDRISACAERVHERVSEFVRVAAVERVQRLTTGATLASSSGSGWLLVTHSQPPDTRVSGASASGDFPNAGASAVTA